MLVKYVKGKFTKRKGNKFFKEKFIRQQDGSVGKGSC